MADRQKLESLLTSPENLLERFSRTRINDIAAIRALQVEAVAFLEREIPPLSSDAIRDLAVKVAGTLPALNLSNNPINPNGELVLSIARTISEFVASIDRRPE